MQTVRDELQHIIFGDDPPGQGSSLKKTQTFLKRYEETSGRIKEQQRVKGKETAALLTFADQENLWYTGGIHAPSQI